jgi:hypothetical protein
LSSLRTWSYNTPASTAVQSFKVVAQKPFERINLNKIHDKQGEGDGRITALFGKVGIKLQAQ